MYLRLQSLTLRIPGESYDNGQSFCTATKRTDDMGRLLWLVLQGTMVEDPIGACGTGALYSL